MSQLKQQQEKQKKKITTTYYLADLIKERRITKLVNMFPKHETDKIRQVREIFNHETQNIFTGRTRVFPKSKVGSQIVYIDDNYVVVRIVSPNYNYYSEYVSASTHHRCVVLGVDNGQTWIHELPWTYFFDHDDHVWTLENIKTVMGFDEELKHDTVFEPRSRVRVQGDIIIQKLEPIDIFINGGDLITKKTLEEEELKQTNLIIGNHLIIIQKAVQIRSVIGDNIMPFVLENTQCYIFHDEHDFITLYLEPGLYSFDLLRRR